MITRVCVCVSVCPQANSRSDVDQIKNGREVIDPLKEIKFNSSPVE